MKKINFITTIDATPANVWKALWDEENYRNWTSVFSEGSYAESDWKEGSKILFLSSGGNGMFGVIEKLIPNEMISFRHMGEIKNGKEETKEWSGAHENYYLKSVNGMTELTAEMDANEEFEEFFRKTFPAAMEKVKTIAEAL